MVVENPTWKIFAQTVKRHSLESGPRLGTGGPDPRSELPASPPPSWRICAGKCGWKLDDGVIGLLRELDLQLLLAGFQGPELVQDAGRGPAIGR